jgi:hypothetical protein
MRLFLSSAASRSIDALRNHSRAAAMNLRFTIRDVLWLTVVVAILLVAFVVRANRVTKWEYRIDYDVTHNSLNENGNEGWELVGTATMPNQAGVALFYKRTKTGL